MVLVVDPKVSKATRRDRKLHAPCLEPLEIDLERLGIVGVGVGIISVGPVGLITFVILHHPRARDLRGGAAVSRGAGSTDAVTVDGQHDRDGRAVFDAAIEFQGHGFLIEGSGQVHGELRGRQAAGDDAIVGKLQRHRHRNLTHLGDQSHEFPGTGHRIIGI